jgi:hypothetical protein
MNRKILIIAYYFPPEGGPAVQRISKFIKYLYPSGYESVVITSKHRVKIFDESLLKDVSDVKRIYRIIDLGFIFGKKIVRLFFRDKYIDQHQLWNYLVMLKIKKILKENKIDLIFSTTPPHSSNLLAYKISQKYLIPWIADFRDEWTYDPNFNRYNKTIIDIERNILLKTSAITTVTKKAQKNFASIIDDPGKTFCIYNGYDVDDYKHISEGKSVNDKKLKIIYTGRFTKKSSPAELFEKLSEFKKSGSIDFKKIDINVVGQEGNKKWLNKYNELKPEIRFTQYQPHNISVKMLAESDVLLLLASNTPDSEVFTGKIFEYLYLKKTILAIIRYRGELSDWLEEYGAVYIGIENETGSVGKAVYNLYNDFINGQLKKNVNEKFVQKYDRRILTESLSNLFGNILAGSNS